MVDVVLTVCWTGADSLEEYTLNHRHSCGRLAGLVAGILGATALAAHAWGPEGHAMVGRIAEKNLTPETLRAVNELLNGTNTVTVHISDNDIANWPDFIRKECPETGPWHFVDIPFAAEKYDDQRDCVAHQGCVVEAIPRFQQALADNQTNTAARVEALKFLVHFVADVHQPLHCAERNGDKGGNFCRVRWPGEPKVANLHSVWDFNLPRKNLEDAVLTPVAYGDRLSGQITAAQAAAWKPGTSADWAWESHQLAVTKVYATIPADGTTITLSADYIASSQPLVDEQLKKAGIRLARLLNDSLK